MFGKFIIAEASTIADVLGNLFITFFLSSFCSLFFSFSSGFFLPFFFFFLCFFPSFFRFIFSLSLLPYLSISFFLLLRVGVYSLPLFSSSSLLSISCFVVIKDWWLWYCKPTGCYWYCTSFRITRYHRNKLKGKLNKNWNKRNERKK